MASGADSVGTFYEWDGKAGEFNDPTQWMPNGVPGSGDEAFITSGTVDITGLTIETTTVELSHFNNEPLELNLNNAVFSQASTLMCFGSIPMINLTGNDVFQGTFELPSFPTSPMATLVIVEGSGTFTNEGLVSVAGEVLNFSTPVDNSASMVVTDGGSISLSSILNNGSIEASDGGSVGVESVTGSGTIKLGDLSQLDSSGNVSAGQTVDVQSAADGVSIIQLFGHDAATNYVNGTFLASIVGFNGRDVLEIQNTKPIDSVSFENNELTLSDDGKAVYQFRLVGNYARDAFVATATSQYGGFEDVYLKNPCFASGTLILTTEGERNVETLTPGDRLISIDGSVEKVVWIGHRRQRNGDVILVQEHALGANRPGRDLVVSHDHGLFLEGVLVQAALLVNGETIRREHRNEVVFYHVELERHAILLAEGAAAESYLDTGNRRQFGNCPLAYDPVEDAVRSEPCAEMIFGGSQLDAIRSRLQASIPA